jgi:hypothetical protein
VQDNPAGINAGVAYRATEMFTVRTGLNHFTFEDGLNYGAITGGFSINMNQLLGFDYAYSTDVIGSDAIHAVSLLIRYGAE